MSKNANGTGIATQFLTYINASNLGYNYFMSFATNLPAYFFRFFLFDATQELIWPAIYAHTHMIIVITVDTHNLTHTELKIIKICRSPVNNI